MSLLAPPNSTKSEFTVESRYLLYQTYMLADDVRVESIIKPLLVFLKRFNKLPYMIVYLSNEQPLSLQGE